MIPVITSWQLVAGTKGRRNILPHVCVEAIPNLLRNVLAPDNKDKICDI